MTLRWCGGWTVSEVGELFSPAKLVLPLAQAFDHMGAALAGAEFPDEGDALGDER